MRHILLTETIEAIVVRTSHYILTDDECEKLEKMDRVDQEKWLKRQETGEPDYEFGDQLALLSVDIHENVLDSKIESNYDEEREVERAADHYR